MPVDPELLDLHRPRRRQPAQHRQLVRGAVWHGSQDEPADHRPDPDPGRRQDTDAATHALIIDASLVRDGRGPSRRRPRTKTIVWVRG